MLLDLLGSVGLMRRPEQLGNQGNGIDLAVELGDVAKGDAADAADGDIRP